MDTLVPTRSKVLQRQIPTILGILVLVLGLGVGIFFFSDGLGVFAPRAAPESTPRNVRITNVSDTGFSVAFVTEVATPGYIKYGQTPTELKARAGDDRDQLAGSIGEFTTHHITVKELDPSTKYYFSLGSNSNSEFDNDGSPYMVQTAPKANNPPAAKTVYGSVVTSAGGPAEGSIVYVSLPGAGELSSLVQNSGSWAIPLTRARNKTTGEFITSDDNTMLSIFVQGATANLISQTTASIATAQPIATLILGQNGTPPSMPITDDTLTNSDVTSATASGAAELLTAATLTAPLSSTESAAFTLPDIKNDQEMATTPVASLSGMLASTPTAIVEDTVVNLTETKQEVVTTSQPIIVGEAKPNVKVVIEIHSDTQINDTVTADASGNFEVDVSQYASQLEPGEHTVTYSYIDPVTGKTVTATKTFTVAPKSTSTTSQVALANTNAAGTTTSQTSTSSAKATTSTSSASTKAVPYSSSNPVPVGGISSTPSAVPATRSSQPATESGIPRSGSVGTTLALVLGGIFFLLTGGWSFWASREWTK